MNIHHETSSPIEADNPLLDPAYAFLRPHQIDPVSKAINYFSTEEAINGEVPLGGAILMPTGSGKTSMAAAIARCEILRQPGGKALHVVSEVELRKQAAKEYAHFVPDLSVVEYTGENTKDIERADVIIICYASLEKLSLSPEFEKLGTVLHIYDEGHHVIDRFWAQVAEGMNKGRRSLCLTGTPAYSEDRDITRQFPHILHQESYADGINNGYVAPIHGYLYRSTGEASSDMAQAIKLLECWLKPESSVLVLCSPGGRCAQARVLKSILDSIIKANEINISVEIADGYVGQKSSSEAIARFKSGETQILICTNMGREGLDVTRLTHMLIIDETKSIVESSQRTGRAARLGVITEVHEFTDGSGVTHVDALKFAWQGPVDSEETREKRSRQASSRASGERRGAFASLEQDTLSALSTTASPTPVSVIEVRKDEGVVYIPYAWDSRDSLCIRYFIDNDRLNELLQGIDHQSQKCEVMGRVVEYFSPEVDEYLQSQLTAKGDPNKYISLLAALREIQDMGAQRVGLTYLGRLLVARGAEVAPVVSESGMVFMGVEEDAFNSLIDSGEIILREPVGYASRLQAWRKSVQAAKTRLPRKSIGAREESKILSNETLILRAESKVATLLSHLRDNPKSGMSIICLNALNKAIDRANEIDTDPDLRRKLEERLKMIDPAGDLMWQVSSISSRQKIAPFKVLYAFECAIF